jgi:hypothetical protein
MKSDVDALVSEFRRLLLAACDGDVNALRSVSAAGEMALQAAKAARDYPVSGPEFEAIFREVKEGLIDVQRDLEARRAQGVS